MSRIPGTTLGRNLLLALGYALLAQATIILALPPGHLATPVWPAAGLALAGVLLYGRAVLPGIFLGALVFNLYQQGGLGSTGDHGDTLLVMTWLSLASTLQAGLAAMLIRGVLGEHNALLKDAAIIKFLLLGGPIGCLLAPTLALGLLGLQGEIPFPDLPYEWLSWWIGDTTGVLLFTPLVLVLFGPGEGLQARARRIPVASGLLILLLLHTLVIRFVIDKVDAQNTLAFRERAGLIKGVLQRKLDVDMEVVRSLGRFIETIGNSDGESFTAFTADTLRLHPEIQALEWIPRVMQAELRDFEQNQGPGFQVRELAPDGWLRPATPRPEYFPVLHLQPRAGNEPAMGFDVCSNPLARAALMTARETGRLTASAPLRLIQEQGAQNAVVIYMPVYRKTSQASADHAKGELLGFTAGVFRIGDLIAATLADVQRPGVWFRLSDTQARERQILFDSSAGRQIYRADDDATQARYDDVLAVAGRVWRIEFSPREGFYDARANWGIWMIFLASGITTAMLVTLLLVLSGRSIRTRHIITAQTAALREKIRQRRDIEAALRISEQKYRDAFGQAPIPIAITDLQGNIVEANDKAIETIGYSREELLSMNIREITHPDDIGMSVEKLHHLVNGEIPSYQIEKRYLHKDGHVIDTLLSTSVIRDEHGRPKHMIAQILDFTARKQSEQQLRMLSTAVSHSPSMVIITDPLGHIEYVNPKFSEITGYDVNEVLGQDVSLLSSKLTPAAVYADLWLTVEAGREWRGELQNRRKDGSMYWVRVDIAPIFNERGEISQYVAIEEDITEARKVSEQISYQASHDPLTGLLNRHELERRLQRVLDTAHENNSEHAFCFMDLDQFKVVNDTSGHIAGDELLRQLASMLKGLLRRRDTLARLGGDEFAILMEHCSLAQAQEKAERICRMISEFKFAWENRSYAVSASIGLVVINNRSKDLTEVLKQADSACYVAKDAGRNRVHTYHAADKELALREGEIHWVSDIHAALEQDRFLLYAQLITPIPAQASLPAYEILLRMRNPEGEIIAPGAFLPAAERYNLSTRIDRWVIDACFNWLRGQDHAQNRFDHISINLSGRSLGDEATLSHIINSWNEAAFDPALVVFEITETAAIANLTAATHFINTLKDHGFGFSLDDFGSGLSSFGYLKTLPVDSLKIDGMFVRDIVDDPIDRAMVRSINEIGHVMGMRTIAEFVENDAILRLLSEIGVDYAQGYGVGRPMPITALTHEAPGLDATAPPVQA